MVPSWRNSIGRSNIFGKIDVLPGVTCGSNFFPSKRSPNLFTYYDCRIPAKAKIEKDRKDLTRL